MRLEVQEKYFPLVPQNVSRLRTYLNLKIQFDRRNEMVTHHLPCSKGGQQGDGLETIRFAVTVHPSIGRVCERHLDCRVEGICDDIFIITCLSKALSCAAEMNKILKADLDMDLNVPRFNVFFLGTFFSLDTARSDLERAVRADPSLANLAAMEIGRASCRERV